MDGSVSRFDSGWSSPAEVRHLARLVLPCVLRRLLIRALGGIRHICHGELLDSSSSIERLLEVRQAPGTSQMSFSDPLAEPEVEVSLFDWLRGQPSLIYPTYSAVTKCTFLVWVLPLQ
jgi:hypothetical protein